MDTASANQVVAIQKSLPYPIHHLNDREGSACATAPYLKAPSPSNNPPVFQPIGLIVLTMAATKYPGIAKSINRNLDTKNIRLRALLLRV
jgi:hypothetical protein